MIVYAFFMTLLVGVFIGVFATVSVAIHMEKRRHEKNKAKIASDLKLHFESTPVGRPNIFES